MTETMRTHAGSFPDLVFLTFPDRIVALSHVVQIVNDGIIEGEQPGPAWTIHLTDGSRISGDGLDGVTYSWICGRIRDLVISRGRA